MSQHLPLRTVLRPACRRCIFAPPSHRRPFSTTPLCSKQKDLDGGSLRLSPGAEREAMLADTSVDILEDMGLFPGTFVRSWDFKIEPSPFKDLKGFRTFQWRWLKTRALDLFQMSYYKWWLRRSKLSQKPKQVFVHFDVKVVAREAYEAIYKNLAAGTLQPLRDICKESFLVHLRDRVAARPPFQEHSWELIGFKKCKVVSNRMTKLPWGPDDRDAPFAMRQVVVSLRAHQKLTITHPPIQPRSRHVGVVSRPPRTVEELAWSPEEGATGTEVEATGTEGELDDTVNVIEKETVEYIVMQKTMQKGVEHEWKCIGFTEPTTVEIIKKMDEFKEREMEYNAQKAAASE